MDRLLYLGMNGAKQIMHAQAVNAHNLANSHTAGFRSDVATFQSIPVDGEGADTRTYVLAKSPFRRRTKTTHPLTQSSAATAKKSSPAPRVGALL